MLRHTNTALFTAITIAATTSIAAAGLTPFTETFATDNASWGSGGDWTVFEPLGWAAPGDGPIAGAGYVTYADTFGDFQPGPFPFTLFRGQDNFNSSGGAFVGDWLSGGITEFSFWVRHNAPIELTYFARFTPAGSNSPSMNFAFEAQPVAANTWTRLSVAIDEDYPGWVVGGGPGTWTNVFGNVGKIQIGAYLGELAGIDEEFSFDLSLVTTAVPAPAAIGVFALAGLARNRRRR